MFGEPRRRFSLAAEILLVIAVTATPLSLGGAPRWATPLAVLLSLAALICVALSVARRHSALPVPPMAWGLIAAALACGLQLIPLPPSVLARLSPAAADLSVFVVAPLGLSSIRPLSVDPPATAWELAKHLGYLAALVSAAYVAASRTSRRRLLQAMALTGTLVAAIGFVHRLFGLTSLFGLYTYRFSSPPLLSTFGNKNHLAGFLILGSSLALGLALEARRRQTTVLWGLAYAAQGVGVLLSLSRAGIGAFVGTQMLLVAWLASGARTSRGRGPALASMGAAVVLAAAAYLAFDPIVAKLETVSSVEKLRASKIEMWPSMSRAAWAYAGTGMGRGAFQVGYSRYQDRDASELFSHAESFPLQLSSELGLPVTLLLLSLSGWAMVRLIRRRSRSPMDVAALCGVLGLVAQNLFDFSLELPACALGAAAVLGALERDEGDGAPRWALATGTLVVGVPLLAVLSVGALWWGRDDFGAAESRVEARVQSASLEDFRALALGEIDRHPADYLLDEWLAQSCADHQQPRDALAFVNRALYLRPIDPTAHLLAARSLLRLGRRAQAFLEYRLAAQAGDGNALVEAVSRVKSLQEALEAVPSAAAETVGAAQWLAPRNPGLATALLEERVKTLEDSTTGPLWLQLSASRRGDKNLDGALVALEQAAAKLPDDPRPVEERAAILSARGDQPAAIEVLAHHVERRPGQLGPWLSLAQLKLGAGDAAGALEVLRRASPFVESVDQRAQWLVAQSTALRAQGKLALALDAMRSAARLEPESTALQYALAHQFEELRRPRDAIHAVEAGKAHDSPEGAVTADAWIARLAAQEQAMRLKDAAPDPGY